MKKKEKMTIYAICRAGRVLGVFTSRMWAEVSLSVINRRARRIAAYAAGRDGAGAFIPEAQSAELCEWAVVGTGDRSAIDRQPTLGEWKEAMHGRRG